ncbi:MAG: hypothetical protein AAGA97_04440, partial [Pseudomonadota bacterium]
ELSTLAPAIRKSMQWTFTWVKNQLCAKAANWVLGSFWMRKSSTDCDSNNFLIPTAMRLSDMCQAHAIHDPTAFHVALAMVILVFPH